MSKTVAVLLTISIAFFATSCLEVDENPNARNQEMEMRELNEALLLLVEEGYDIDTTDLGIYYVLHEEGEGPTAMEGDTLSLEYSGYLFGGLIFDASGYHYQDGIWEFVFDPADLIPGFADGISVLNKGAALDMIIPSEYAYGATGNGIIEPYTSILFTVLMHDLKSGQDTLTHQAIAR